MLTPCPYCKGTKKFRHERPANVSDRWWFKMVGQAFTCPLCRGSGVADRPLDSLVIDSGLIFIKTLDNLVQVGCPDPSCKLWIDCTEAFSSRDSSNEVGLGKRWNVPTGDFTAKCMAGHDLTITITPSMGRG